MTATKGGVNISEVVNGGAWVAGVGWRFKSIKIHIINAAAAKDADILFVEGITRKNVKYATWGGDTEEEKVELLGK